MQIDGRSGLGTGLLVGGAGLALAAPIVTDTLYRNRFGALRNELDDMAGPGLEQFGERIARFDRQVGTPLSFAKRLGIGLGVAAAVAGAGLLVVDLMKTDGD